MGRFRAMVICILAFYARCNIFNILADFSLLERGWKEQYDKTEKKCIHGASCKAGPACSGIPSHVDKAANRRLMPLSGVRQVMDG